MPGQNETDLIDALEAIPGAIAGMAVVYFIGLRDAIPPVRAFAMRRPAGRRRAQTVTSLKRSRLSSRALRPY